MSDKQRPERVPGHRADSTQALDASAFAENNPRRGHHPEQLFETYEPRSVRAIVEQRRAQRESEAAHAARVLLEGVEPPEFEPSDPRMQRTIEMRPGPSRTRLHSGSGRSRSTAIRVQRVSALGQLATPGAQFVYALLTIMLLSGLLGLAASTNSPQLILMTGIATPMLLPICIWKWIRWLDSDPYYYRLLTSLGEDARNLLQYRLLWKRSDPRF